MIIFHFFSTIYPVNLFGICEKFIFKMVSPCDFKTTPHHDFMFFKTSQISKTCEVCRFSIPFSNLLLGLQLPL